MGQDNAAWSGGDPDDVTAWTLVRAYHAVGRLFYEALAPHGLTPQQFGILIELTTRPSQSQGALARRVLATPQSLGVVLRTMESNGLVHRSSERGPGRPIAVSATATGRRLLERATPQVLVAVSPVNLGLDERRSAHLNDELHALLDHVTRQPHDR